MTLDGEEIRRLPVPPHPAYGSGRFCPTDVAVNETQCGGDGHVWVADGYGESLVHEFDEHGAWLRTLTGETGLGRFLEPHAVFIDHRKEVPELYVADRGHSRIQVFDLDGTFLRGVGVGELISPGGFAKFGTGLLVAELDARITILGPDDEIVERFGEGTMADREVAGWPNSVSPTGEIVRPVLEPGVLRTPHGITADAEGNVYVSEWLVGGRVIKLAPVTPH
jgi:DNA-binding beta-propeller fold protein YncE